MAIDDKSQNSQPMRYKNFDEWFNTQKYNLPFTIDVRAYMLEAWDAAVNNDSIGEQIKELLNTLNDAEKIDCACDQIQIATGYRCGCGRGMALRQAGEGLGKYLRKLRKSLK